MEYYPENIPLFYDEDLDLGTMQLTEDIANYDSRAHLEKLAVLFDMEVYSQYELFTKLVHKNADEQCLPLFIDYDISHSAFFYALTRNYYPMLIQYDLGKQSEKYLFYVSSFLQGDLKIYNAIYQYYQQDNSTTIGDANLLLNYFFHRFYDLQVTSLGIIPIEHELLNLKNYYNKNKYLPASLISSLNVDQPTLDYVHEQLSNALLHYKMNFVHYPSE
jgi:hypothetical protein